MKAYIRGYDLFGVRTMGPYTSKEDIRASTERLMKEAVGLMRVELLSEVGVESTPIFLAEGSRGDAMERNAQGGAVLWHMPKVNINKW
jgi:hypothetical protein